MRRIFISIFWITMLLSGVFAQDAAKLNFTATDKSGGAVGDLKKEEVTLVVDGKPQIITSLEKQETPLIYALAIDCSGSMRMLLGDLIGAGKSIFNQNRKDDETMLISFISSDKIRGMESFSADKNILTRTLDNFYIEGGQTALIDAIYMAVKEAAGQKKADGEKYRRAVVVITDGEERASFYNEKELLDLIQKENVQVFFIGLVGLLSNDGGLFANTKSPRYIAESFIQRIAGASGGAVIIPKKIKDLPEAAAQLMPLLQSQYVINYTPVVDAKAKSQKIELKLAEDSKRKDVKFYFRSGS